MNALDSALKGVFVVLFFAALVWALGKVFRNRRPAAPAGPAGSTRWSRFTCWLKVRGAAAWKWTKKHGFGVPAWVKVFLGVLAVVLVLGVLRYIRLTVPVHQQVQWVWAFWLTVAVLALLLYATGKTAGIIGLVVIALLMIEFAPRFYKDMGWVDMNGVKAVVFHGHTDAQRWEASYKLGAVASQGNLGNCTRFERDLREHGAVFVGNMELGEYPPCERLREKALAIDNKSKRLTCSSCDDPNVVAGFGTFVGRIQTGLRLSRP